MVMRQLGVLSTPSPTYTRCTRKPVHWRHFPLSEFYNYCIYLCFRCLKLCPVETKLSSFELRNCFSLNLQKEEYCAQRIRFTSSGREIKTRNDQLFNNPGFESVLDVDYEDELDLLVVLQSNNSEDPPCGTIGLYDNQTGALVLETVVTNWIQDADHSIMMEKDTIVHIMKDCSRKFCCIIYRLTP